MPKREHPSRCHLDPRKDGRKPHHYLLWTGRGEEVRCRWCGRAKKAALRAGELKEIKKRERWRPLPTHLWKATLSDLHPQFARQETN